MYQVDFRKRSDQRLWAQFRCNTETSFAVQAWAAHAGHCYIWTWQATVYTSQKYKSIKGQKQKPGPTRTKGMRPWLSVNTEAPNW